MSKRVPADEISLVDSDDEVLVICETKKKPSSSELVNINQVPLANFMENGLKNNVKVNIISKIVPISKQHRSKKNDSSDIEIMTMYRESLRAKSAVSASTEDSNDAQICIMEPIDYSKNAQVEDLNNVHEEDSNNAQVEDSMHAQVCITEPLDFSISISKVIDSMPLNLTKPKAISSAVNAIESNVGENKEECNSIKDVNQEPSNGNNDSKKEEDNESITTSEGEESDEDETGTAERREQYTSLNKPPTVRKFPIVKSACTPKRGPKKYILYLCKNCNASFPCQKNSRKVRKVNNVLYCRACASIGTLSVILHQCKICETTIPGYLMMVKHLKFKCASNEFWSCSQCKYASTTEELLAVHVKNKHCHEGSKKKSSSRRDKKKKNCKSTTDHQDTNKEIEVEKLVSLNCVRCEKDIAFTSNKICVKCNSLLTHRCLRCDYMCKSYCGIFDHIQNECGKSCTYCDRVFFKKDELLCHQNSCPHLVRCCKFSSCKFQTKSKYALANHHRSAHNKENVNN